ncbi:MAG: POT family protein [Coxiella sp. RIFCSPHIGHO2_12_FULL_44_14]|nr:MAG: POT family protein [Coxiella sp. RIFCSPHIGHO2_12_FULL_44_14]
MNLSLPQSRFLRMPKGFSALYFTQLFSTISFAVLFATLLLYMKEQVHLSTTEANLITGVYFAYNFALHLLSGYLGGRFFSYRALVVNGIIFQLVGCLILAHGTMTSLYWGLAFMLIGTGTMVTCLNMLLSQLFQPEEIQKRQTAFLWNYSSMNIGFILGFTLAGYYQLHVNYTLLFLITAANNILALGILCTQWKQLRDHNTFISRANHKERWGRYAVGISIVLLLTPLLHTLLQHARISDALVLTTGVVMVVTLLVIALRHTGAERKKLFAFFILLMSAQIFWMIYQLAPMSLTLFAVDNVKLQLWNFSIAPGWIQNINSVTIALGAPLLALFFAWLRRKKQSSVSLPLQYSSGLTLSSLGLLILPIGIALGHHGYMAFGWLFLTYVLQAIAELLISPIGYAMVGQLVPMRWQSLYMGTLLLNTGVAAVLASFFSNYAVGTSGSSNPLITNPSYSHAFSQLGWWTLGVALILLLLTPLINRFINSSSSSSRKETLGGGHFSDSSIAQ